MTLVTMRGLVLSTLFLLVLPVAATSQLPVDCSNGEGVAAGAAAALFSEDPLLDLLNEGQAPIPQGCTTYSCQSSFDCPDIIDMPPGQCVGGCCDYESSCQTTCQFDSDCGEEASCWSGCCFYWNRS